MPLLFLYPETLGNGCSRFKSCSLLSHFTSFDTKEFKPHTRTHHIVIIVIIGIIAMLTLCYSIMSSATLVLLYHTPMSTLLNSLISHVLWLPQSWYYGLLWETEIQFWNWWAFKLSVKWTKTMLSDRNIFMENPNTVGSLWPHHDNIMLLEAHDNWNWISRPLVFTLNPVLFDRPKRDIQQTM